MINVIPGRTTQTVLPTNGESEQVRIGAEANYLEETFEVSTTSNSWVTIATITPDNNTECMVEIFAAGKYGTTYTNNHLYGVYLLDSNGNVSAMLANQGSNQTLQFIGSGSTGVLQMQSTGGATLTVNAVVRVYAQGDAMPTVS